MKKYAFVSAESGSCFVYSAKSAAYPLTNALKSGKMYHIIFKPECEPSMDAADESDTNQYDFLRIYWNQRHSLRRMRC